MKHILTILVILLTLAACSPTPAPPPMADTPALPETIPAPPPDIPLDFIERMDGSTATQPLAKALLEKVCGTSDGLVHYQTDPAYQNLIAGDKDLIFVTYPSESELYWAQESGVELEIIPVVKDALVFLNNIKNPIDSATQAQLRDLYSGRRTTWWDAAQTPATAYQRPLNSGSQTLFLQLVMAGDTPADAPSELRPSAMMGLIDVVASYDNSAGALGYSMFYYAHDMYSREEIRLLAVDDVLPDATSIADGSYPYTTYYYAVMRADTPPEATARQLVDYLLSQPGQALAVQAGYVPLDPGAVTTAEPEFYGFLGSTPENVSQSSGTGGTLPRSLSETKSYSYSPASSLPLEFTLGEMANEQAQVWLAAAPPLSEDDGDWAEFNLKGDLLSINVNRERLNRDGDSPEPQAWAEPETVIYDLREGQALKLSDLFYDDVNYIEYINEEIRRYLQTDEWGYAVDETYLQRPFTGIPADYPYFYLNLYGDVQGQTVLMLRFPHDNPFFTGESWFRLTIPLPIDLSPWGNIYQLEHNFVAAGVAGEPVDVPRLRLSLAGDSAVEAKINAEIQQLFETAQAAGAFANDDYFNPFQSELWGHNLNLGYIIADDMMAAMSVVDIRTGERVEVSPDILPADWWLDTANFFIYGADVAADYKPAAGSQIKNFWVGWSHLRFEVYEPGRSGYAVYLQTDNIPSPT
jgi:phosphate transport system substrate-binding protein